MIVEVHANFSAAFNFKVTNPATAVRQYELEGVMSRLEFNHANCLGGISLGLSINAKRKTAWVGRDFDLSVLDFLLLCRVRGAGSTSKCERHGDHNSDRCFD